MTSQKKHETTLKTSVITQEIDLFSTLSDSWWEEDGHFAPLHQMNPCRLEFIRNEVLQHLNKNTGDTSGLPYTGLDFLDIGCGGGLVCEPIARLGGKVTGIDASEKAIEIARAHANQNSLTIAYNHTTAETLAQQDKRFDVITALEIVEHVADLNDFMASISALLRPGGLAFVSTLNRNTKSFIKAIIAAEYVLRWLPRGTHDWQRFIKPHELVKSLHHNGLTTLNMNGMLYNPLTGGFSLSEHNLDVNYILCCQKVCA